MHWRFPSCLRTSWISSRIIASNILNCVTGLKDLLRDVFNAGSIDLLGRRLHIEIVFHYVNDRGAAEVENYTLVIMYFLRRLWNPESLSWGKSLSIIEKRFVESVLERLGENLGGVFFVRIIVISEAVECMDAHEASWSLRSISPVGAVLQAWGCCHVVHISKSISVFSGPTWVRISLLHSLVSHAIGISSGNWKLVINSMKRRLLCGLWEPSSFRGAAGLWWK